MKLNWPGNLFILLQFATCQLHSCFQRFVSATACVLVAAFPFTTLLRLTRDRAGKKTCKGGNPNHVRFTAQGELNLHLRNVYSFRARPCERHLMFACRQTAVIDVAYGPSRRRTDGEIILMVKLDTGVQCACVQRTLPHAGPTLETTVRPLQSTRQTAGQDHPLQQQHFKVALHLVSIVCSAQKSYYTIYQCRYLPWLSHWPPTRRSTRMNKSQRTNFKSVYN